MASSFACALCTCLVESSFPRDLDESVKKLRAFCQCGMPAANYCAIAKLLQEILELSSFMDGFLFISGKQRSNGGGKGDAWWVWLTVRGRRRSCEGLVREALACAFGEPADCWAKDVGTSRHPYRTLPATPTTLGSHLYETPSGRSYGE